MVKMTLLNGESLADMSSDRTELPRKRTPKLTEEAGRQTVQSVERTFDVLEALAAARQPVSISELSQKLGLHISTVHRLLGTLIERGYARQDESGGRYAIGPRLLE